MGPCLSPHTHTLTCLPYPAGGRHPQQPGGALWEAGAVPGGGAPVPASPGDPGEGTAPAAPPAESLVHGPFPLDPDALISVARAL